MNASRLGPGRCNKFFKRGLTKQLRELEADGIVHRKVFAVVPPRVDYSVTDKGHKLRQVIDAWGAWGAEFRK